MGEGDLGACFEQVADAIEKLTRMGLDYQRSISAPGEGAQAKWPEAREVQSEIEAEFDRTMTPGPLPVVRALQVRGADLAATALDELWRTVFEVTSLLTVGVGVDWEEVLEYDVRGKSFAACEALQEARETALSTGSVSQLSGAQASAATDAVLFVDAVVRLGGDSHNLREDPDSPFPMGVDEDETNEEAQLRTKREFDRLSVEPVSSRLSECGLGRHAQAIARFYDSVRLFMESHEAQPGGLSEFSALGDKLIHDMIDDVRKNSGYSPT